MKIIITIKIVLLVCFIFTFTANAKDCKNGYNWESRSEIGCVQTNCKKIPNAHYGYVRDCVCGSSGSIKEDPKDPNKECYYDQDYKECPECVYACVGINDECPKTKKESEIKKEDTQKTKAPSTSTTPQTSITPQPLSSPGSIKSTNNAGAKPPTLTTKSITKRSCKQECERLKMGGKYDEVLEFSGEYPKCKCNVEIRDDKNRLIKTISQNKDKRSTYEFNPKTGKLLKKNTISIQEERERVRQSLGYKYSEEEIDALLEEDKINKWFDFYMKNIDTRTKLLDPQFWWQHFVALLDHGHKNSADFVDIHNYGRCGDSMQWLEENFKNALKLNGKKDNISEAMISITGEKYGNFLNHTAIMIRPAGISNIEWADMVKELTDKSGNKGISGNDLKNLDPRLLNAKVLDPYFKKRMTVKEFIKGWSVVKIS